MVLAIEMGVVFVLLTAILIALYKDNQLSDFGKGEITMKNG